MSKPTILFHRFRFPLFRAVVWVIIGNSLEATFDFAEDKTSEKVASEEERKCDRSHVYAP